jgi:flagellar P-ring protein FlgI
MQPLGQLLRSFKVIGSLLYLACMAVSPYVMADEQLRLRDICRLKGHEKNTLQGYGLVVGLKGTGDDKSNPTTRGLARALLQMGANITTDQQGIPKFEELADSKNAAQVIITAEIPPVGAQQGDLLDCKISAISAKSLEGGVLVPAAMIGPRPDVPVVFAVAHGEISISNRTIPTTGEIMQGCKMERTIKNEFVEDGKITLVLKPNVGSFATAQSIEDEINALNRSGIALNSTDGSSEPTPIAKAIDPIHIEVTIPPSWQHSPVKFVSVILDRQLRYLETTKRIVVNKREGVVVVGADVLISPVSINHKNLAIEAKAGARGFIPFDSDNPGQPQTKLKNLTDALNALAVPTEDVIAILETLDHQGVIYGEFIVQ